MTDCAVLMVEGAVYSPFDKVPVAGDMDHETEVSELPLTVAVNCLAWDAVRLVLEGLTTTLTPVPEAGES